MAPYIVGAPPQPVGATPANGWFWDGIALVLVFFLAVMRTTSAREIIATPSREIKEMREWLKQMKIPQP